MSVHLHALLCALAFLTRLPPARRAFTGDHPLGADAHTFPVAGLVIALPGALLLLLAHALGLSAAVGALLAIAVTIALTGGLHEDGLADTADGLFGHHGSERALAIMKDSRVGTYGALALLLAVLARLVLLAEIAGVDIFAAMLAFAGAHAASRGAMTHLWSSLPSADPGGLAASVGAPDSRTGHVALGSGLLILALLGAVAAGSVGLLLPALLALLAHLAYRRWLRRRLGGQTGDTIGADQQAVEIAVLLGFALAL